MIMGTITQPQAFQDQAHPHPQQEQERSAQADSAGVGVAAGLSTDMNAERWVGIAAAKDVHAPSSVQSPAAPPGTSASLHHLAVQRCPL